MKYMILTVVAAFGVLAQAAGRSGWEGIPSTDFELKNFPQEGSRAYDKDFETLEAYQQSRTPQQCREGQRMRYPQFSVLFKSEILNPDEMSLVRPLMDRVGGFTERVADYYKAQFERPRPYDTDRRLHPCVPKPGGAKSYPSSHAAVASAVSCLLIEVFPDKESDLKSYGHEIAELRAVIGVHHPSDVKAGERLGADICERLKSEPDLKEELKDLKKSARQL